MFLAMMTVDVEGMGGGTEDTSRDMVPLKHGCCWVFYRAALVHSGSLVFPKTSLQIRELPPVVSLQRSRERLPEWHTHFDHVDNI
jgi:hypothetical protein